MTHVGIWSDTTYILTSFNIFFFFLVKNSEETLFNSNFGNWMLTILVIIKFKEALKYFRFDNISKIVFWQIILTGKEGRKSIPTRPTWAFTYLYDCKY